jgi:hypothetical protein
MNRVVTKWNDLDEQTIDKLECVHLFKIFTLQNIQTKLPFKKFGAIRKITKYNNKKNYIKKRLPNHLN